MRSYSKLVSLVAVGVASLLALSACGGSADTAASGTDSVITAFNTEPQNPLIPGNTNETSGGRVVDNINSRLVAFDAKGNVKNEIADSIKASDNNTVYTIKLKDGWKFSDGTPIDAKSFTKSWSYTANAANAQLNASFFENIKGYDELQEKTVKSDAQLSGLKVVDDKTFEVSLKSPDSVFPIEVGYAAFAPLPESFFKDPKAFGEKPVSSGPYKFESWNHNHEIKIVKNENYKGNFPAKNAGITFKVYTDPDAAYADVQAGNLDVLDTVPTSQNKTFRTDSAVQAYSKPGSVIQTVTFPSTLAHFGNDEEGMLRRRAISMAINRPQLVDKVLGGLGTPAKDYVAPPISGYDPDLKGNDVLKYNPTEAKKLWEKANAIKPWTASDKLTFSFNADGGAKPLYEAIANQVKNVLGITTATNPVATFQQFRTEISERKLNTAFRTAWQPDYPSIQDYLVPLYSSQAADGKGANDGDYKNPQFDELCKKAAEAPSLEEANKLYQQAEELLLKDLPVIPLYNSNASGVTAKNIKGLEVNWQAEPVYSNLTK